MRFDDREILSIGDLIANLKEHLRDCEGPVWYRGQSISRWKLEPKLLRVTPSPSETHLLNRFKQNASILLNRQPQSEFEWLFLMQHYSVPTRLLDWSESPLAALYFALGGGHDDEEGALWILLPTVLNEKSNYRPDFHDEIPSFEDYHLRNYLPETIAGERRSSLFPMAAIAPRNSSRMQAQQGVFTISHRENIVIEDVGAEGSPRDHVWRYTIPGGQKGSIAEELCLLGYTKFQLFPELESVRDIIQGV